MCPHASQATCPEVLPPEVIISEFANLLATSASGSLHSLEEIFTKLDCYTISTTTMESVIQRWKCTESLLLASTMKRIHEIAFALFEGSPPRILVRRLIHRLMTGALALSLHEILPKSQELASGAMSAVDFGTAVKKCAPKWTVIVKEAIHENAFFLTSVVDSGSPDEDTDEGSQALKTASLTRLFNQIAAPEGPKWMLENIFQVTCDIGNDLRP